MNKRNLAAAVLAGLTGAAGLAGTVRADDDWYINAYGKKIEMVLAGGRSCEYDQSDYGYRFHVPRDGEVILDSAQYRRLLTKEEKELQDEFYTRLADQLKRDCEEEWK